MFVEDTTRNAFDNIKRHRRSAANLRLLPNNVKVFFIKRPSGSVVNGSCFFQSALIQFRNLAENPVLSAFLSSKHFMLVQ
jgi:hypothetical protein